MAADQPVFEKKDENQVTDNPDHAELQNDRDANPVDQDR
jgi:hypothetical protein